jgi:hypothetical protein
MICSDGDVLDSHIYPSIVIRVPLVIATISFLEWTFCIALSICYQDAGDYETLRKAYKKKLASMVSDGIANGAGRVKRQAEAYGPDRGVNNATGTNDAVGGVGSELDGLDIQYVEPQASCYPPAYEVSVYLIQIGFTDVLLSSQCSLIIIPELTRPISCRLCTTQNWTMHRVIEMIQT